ncbi:SixA phosphatase family protein [Cecembia calidifontis]|jgi:phosphohistidine phosphatase|uniref:Phosphohistidine phosphatase n=1 Tax=Cecembia calidifontis TaxID=1187080 RepID=A0A4Q7PBC8_9BACT|nr:histidine phosphatase family protein [Cecembia calidifontis]RZS97554.1 phosphohistidine phosphatase [Cecembia calidifontis]
MANSKKVLYLLRHGEAEPGFGQIGDYERPLTDKGKKQINRLAVELFKSGVELDLMVSSSSKRTMETARILSSILTCKKSDSFPDLYEADPKTILRVINQTDASIQNLLIVGHNPGISALATFLSGETYLIMKPGMLAKLEIYMEDWASVGQNTAGLIEIIQ